jgi:hypothetical protein
MAPSLKKNAMGGGYDRSWVLSAAIGEYKIGVVSAEEGDMCRALFRLHVWHICAVCFAYVKLKPLQEIHMPFDKKINTLLAS